MAITYVPMARGFVYLVAVIGGFSRTGLAWRLSITLETRPCAETLREALAWHGTPEIMNTDQGSQFTAVAFLTALPDAQIAISMEGKGATLSWSNGFGGRSNRRQAICAPIEVSRRRGAA